MQWSITTPAATYPVTAQQVADQTRLDDLTAESAWVAEAIADATAYAETETQLSFITRTITAQFWPEKSGILPEANPFPAYSCLPLFRGPLQSVTSVKDLLGNAVSYQTRTVGNLDFVQLNGSTIGPVQIVYVAGFGDTAAAVPADIRRGILAHVAHLYIHREADADSVPSGLDRIYGRYSAGGAIG